METVNLRFFVGGLRPSTTKEDVERYFKTFGNIKSCEIIIEMKTGKNSP